MMKIAILGTGMVGRTIAVKLSQLGHKVTIGTRDTKATGICSRWILPSTAGSSAIKTTRRKLPWKDAAIKAEKFFRRRHDISNIF